MLGSRWGYRLLSGGATERLKHMRIELQREGGLAYLPGLHRKISLDSNQLESQDAKELERLVRDADFFSLAANFSARSGSADFQVYTLTITDGSRTHTVRAADPISDPNLGALIDFVTTKTKLRSSRS